MNPTNTKWLYRSSRSVRFFILLLSCFFLLRTEAIQASHFTGGEISYECLGSNQYRVKLSQWCKFCFIDLSFG